MRNKIIILLIRVILLLLGEALTDVFPIVEAMALELAKEYL